MKTKLLVLKLIIIVYMFVLWYYFYPVLPSIMPIHWNYAWVADNFAPKLRALLMFPILSLGIFTMFYFLPKLDPKKANYPKFEKAWEAFQISLLVFFAYIYTISIYATLNPEINMWKYMMIWLWILFIIMGNYMWKIRRNYFIWIRLPWTIDNEEVWNKTHRLWGKCFMIAWLIFLINAFLNLNPAIVFGLIISSVLIIPVVYSYLEFKKISNIK